MQRHCSKTAGGYGEQSSFANLGEVAPAAGLRVDTEAADAKSCNLFGSRSVVMPSLSAVSDDMAKATDIGGSTQPDDSEMPKREPGPAHSIDTEAGPLLNASTMCASSNDKNNIVVAADATSSGSEAQSPQRASRTTTTNSACISQNGVPLSRSWEQHSLITLYSCPYAAARVFLINH